SAIVGIAAAPDFTERRWESLTFEDRARLGRDGAIHVPNRYGGGPTPITRALIEDGREHVLLDKPILLDCKVRLLHGQADPAVRWERALRIAARLTSADVEVILVKDGDHRLSRPRDLALIRRTVESLLVP